MSKKKTEPKKENKTEGTPIKVKDETVEETKSGKIETAKEVIETKEDNKETKIVNEAVKTKRKIPKLVISVAVALIIVGALIFALYQIEKSNAEKLQEETEQYWNWLKKNCECVEHAQPTCALDGFVFDWSKRLCINSAERLVTATILKCSAYNCSGQNVTWTNKTWEPKLIE